MRQATTRDSPFAVVICPVHVVLDSSLEGTSQHSFQQSLRNQLDQDGVSISLGEEPPLEGRSYIYFSNRVTQELLVESHASRPPRYRRRGRRPQKHGFEGQGFTKNNKV
jgi:hypothetical protein